jgi:hypothetical protein
MVLGGTSAPLHGHGYARDGCTAPNPKWRLDGIALCWEVAARCVTRRVHGRSALVLRSALYTFSVRTNPDTELSWAGGVQAAAKRFLPFEEAREFARKQKMTKKADWKQWCREGNRPKDVPYDPDKVRIRPSLLLYDNPVACTDESTSGGMFSTDCRLLGRMLDSQAYKNEGWVSWADWLGYGVGQPPVGTFLSFEEARELVWNEGLTTRQQWREWCDACSPLYSNLIGFSSLTRVDQV